MADVEQQKIAVELRKFRKKLRQIEKLEELERELTDEEIFKLSKKDEVRSTVQQLVAREDALKFKLQEMAESDGTQDEQASTEQEEQQQQQRSENTQALVQTSDEGSQGVSNENELTINEIYDQAPVLEPGPSAVMPDVVSTVQTRPTTRPASTVMSNQTYMRFQVRNLQGHNDLICGVDCRGSVLVSGRGNYHVQGCVKSVKVEKRVCKRKCIVQQDQDRRSRSESSGGTKKQRTDNEMVSSAHRPSQGESNKRKTPAITENVVGMIVDESQDQWLRSDYSTRTKKQRMDTEICSVEDRLPHTESCPVITEIDDDTMAVVEPVSSETSNQAADVIKGMVGDQSQDKLFSLSKSDQVILTSEGNIILTSEHQRLLPVTSNPSTVVDKSQGQPVSSSKSDGFHLAFECQQLQPENSNQADAITENVVEGMFADQRQDPDQTLTLGNSEHEEKQAESSNQTASMAEKVYEGMVANQSQDQLVSSSKSGQVHLMSESGSSHAAVKTDQVGLLPGKHQQLWAEANIHTAMMTENVGGMVEDQSQGPDQTLSSSKSGQVNLMSDGENTLPSERLLVKTSNQAAATIESVEGMEVDQTDDDSDERLPSRKTSHLHLKIEIKGSLPTELQQVAEDHSHQAAAVKESVVEGMDVDQTDHDSDERLPSRKTSHLHLKIEIKGSLPTELQQVAEDHSHQAAAVIESVVEGMDVDQTDHDSDERLPSRKTSHLHLKIEIKGSLPTELQQVAEDHSQDEPLFSSKSGHVYLDSFPGKQDHNPDPDPPLSASKSVQVDLICASYDETLEKTHQETQTGSSLERVAKAETTENEMLVDQSEGQHVSPSTSGQILVASENKLTLPSEHQQPQTDTCNQTAASTENADDGMVVDQSQDQLACSSKSSLVYLMSESKSIISSECQQPQAETSSRAIVMIENADDRMVVDQSQDQLAQFGQVHLKSESKEPSPSEHQQLQAETSNQTAAIIGNAENRTVVDQSQDQPASSSKSGQVHLTSESKETLPRKHQQLQAETSSHAVAMIGNADVGMVVDQSQDLPMSSSKSGQLHLTFESKETLPREHRQLLAETSSHAMAMIGNADDGMVVDQVQDQPASTSKSGQVHLTSESKETLPSEHQQLQAEISNQTVAITQNVDARMVEGGSQVLNQVLNPTSCSSKTGLVRLMVKMWEKVKFYTRILKGHSDSVCGVDCQNAVLVSEGRDTMLKLWDADTGREMRSMGGHTGTITSVFLIPNKEMSSSAVPSGFRTDQYSVLTGSKDCSMKLWSLANGQIKRSMYAFSPVECLDCNSNILIAAGLDGGKLELWDLENGTAVRSVRGNDEDAVTAVKFQDDRVVTGSATGVVKVWDIRDNSLKPVMSSDQAPVDNTAGNVAVKPRRVRCLATTQDTVYWGDNGVNMKAMDLKSGKLRKIRNHVTDFGSTGAMATTGSCLVSAGYDLDRGNGYLNVRSLPSEEYLATVDDECTGSITCLSCTQTTRDQVTLHRMCTGGLELKLWDQLPGSKVKKRSRPETDDIYITAKHLRRYSLPDISDTESSEDDDDQPEGDDSDDDDDVSNTGSASRSWCTIS